MSTPSYSEPEPYPEKPIQSQGTLNLHLREGEEEEKEVIISCENIHKTYLLGIEGVAALRGVSVDVYRGELLVIYGTSGGGKSTLLNVLGTIDVPTKGNLALMNTRITDQSEDAMLARLRCKNIGFVFQSFNLLGTMTALENVSLPMVIAGDKTAAEIKERATQLLTDVGLGHRLDHIAGHLSGGEQQRVTIARAMANDPDIMLMDEPTGDLDSKNTELVLNILLSLNRSKKMTMVMVTHDVYMKQYADRVLYLRDGRVHRIETIDPNVRNGAYDNLTKAVVARFQGVLSPLPESRALKKTVRKRGDYALAVASKGIQSSEKLNRVLLHKLFGSSEDQLLEDMEKRDLMGGAHSQPSVSTANKRQQEFRHRQDHSNGSGSPSNVPPPHAYVVQPHQERSGDLDDVEMGVLSVPLKTVGSTTAPRTTQSNVEEQKGAAEQRPSFGSSEAAAAGKYSDEEDYPKEQDQSPAASPTVPLKQLPNTSLDSSPQELEDSRGARASYGAPPVAPMAPLSGPTSARSRGGAGGVQGASRRESADEQLPHQPNGGLPVPIDLFDI